MAVGGVSGSTLALAAAQLREAGQAAPSQKIGAAPLDPRKAIDFLAKLEGIKEPTPHEKLTQGVQSLALSVSGLANAIESHPTQLAKINPHVSKLLGQVDRALMHPAVLAVVSEDPKGDQILGKLQEGLERLRDVSGAYLDELIAVRKTVDPKQDPKMAGALGNTISNVWQVYDFTRFATDEPTLKALPLVNDVGGGLFDFRTAIQVAGAISSISEHTGISRPGVARALRWYVGHMTEIGFTDPERFHEELAHQASGNAPKIGLPISPSSVMDRAYRGADFLIEVAQQHSPTTEKGLINSIRSSIEIRSSQTHPLQVAWVPTPAGGKLGVTLAPGKSQPSLYGYVWKRDLDEDFTTLKQQHGVDTLVPLIEDWEYDVLDIADYGEKAKQHGFDVQPLSITDQEVPKKHEVEKLTDNILARLEQGENVLVHCKGGLGRAGTVAAISLVKMGVPWELAMKQVRDVRPGAIENKYQEQFIEAFATGKL